MGTKHELIIKYITNLDIGSRISVRRIAQEMGVSEGTAYRAIKEAEAKELVKTLPRAGTYRIEKKDNKSIERLSFDEITAIVDGTVLAGFNGLDRNLTKFVIGAMTIEAMEKYLSPGDIVIVGNREEVHEFALKNGCAVLISGGFVCNSKIKELAERKGLPVISSPYDTFTIATIINRAVSNIKNQSLQDGILEEIVLSSFENIRLPNGMQFTGRVTPMLLSHMGVASWSSISMLMCTAGIIALRKFRQPDIMIDSFNVFFIHPLEVDDKLDIFVEVIKEVRSYNKAEISLKHDVVLIAKALISVKNMRR